MEIQNEIQLKENALVKTGVDDNRFAEYADVRDKWLSTPIAHNGTLARGGYPFTIIDATKRIFQATELDVARGYNVGDPIEKIAYLCISQMDWTHYSVNDEDVTYKKDEPFIILFNPNPIRESDLTRIETLLADGPVPNIAAREYANRTKGFNPSIGLVAFHQWKSLA